MFELLFGVDTWLRQQGKRERFQLTFFNAAAEPGQRLGPKAVAGLLAEMKRRGVVLHLGHKIKGFLDGGEYGNCRFPRRPDPFHARPHWPGVG